MRFFLTAICLLLVIGPASLRADDRDAIFYDDFSRLDPDWGDTNDELRSENKKLVLLPDANRGYTALLRTRYEDADIHAKFSLAEGDTGEPAGIVFWSDGLDSYYVAAIKTTGTFAIFRLFNHRWMFPASWQTSDAIKQGLGQTNELRVVTQGNLATVYVNDQQVTAIHGFPPEGRGDGRCRIGLHAESGDSRNRWEFSEFKILKAPPATAPAASDGNTLFADDFATLDPGWGSVSDWERVEGGKLIIQPPTKTPKFVLYQGSAFGDADIRVSATESTGESYATTGLLFWATDTADFYTAAIQPDGTFGVSRVVSNKMTDVAIWKVNAAVNKGANQVNNLRVVTRGDAATCYINDQQVAAFKGFPPSGGGQIGFYCESDKTPCRFELSGLKVLKPQPASAVADGGDSGPAFSDDFATFDPSWGATDDQFRVDNNKLVVRPNVHGLRFALYGRSMFGDADLRVTVSQAQGTAGQVAALAFWGDRNDGSFYIALIASNGMFSIHRWSSGRWLYPTSWQNSAAIKQGLGQKNDLRVVTQGNLATMYINGQQVTAIRGFPPSGLRKFGVYAESGDPASTWEFSAFKIFQPSAGGSVASSPGDNSTIFTDDFAVLDPGWGLASDNERVNGNKLVLQPLANRSWSALYQGSLFNDSDIRATIVQAQGNSDEPAGICFWSSDTNNYYVAAAQTNGMVAILRLANGRWLFPSNWKKSDAVKQGLGQANELRVVTQGNLATFYINGQQVTAIRGFPPSGGSFVGIHAESGATPYVWQVSDFKVLKAPAGGPAAAGGGDSNVLLADDFATLDPDWGDASDNLQVKNNQLLLQPAANRNYVDFYQGNLFGDSDIRAKLTVTQGEDTRPSGIAFWAVDVNSFYVAGILPNGQFGIFRCLNHRWLFPVDWQASDAIKKGLSQTNDLRVVTQGNQATLYVNNQQVVTTRGFAPTGGSLIGFYSESGNKPTIAGFSDLKLLKAPPGGPAAANDADPDLLFSDDFATLDPAWGPVGDEQNVDNHKLVITPKKLHQDLYFGTLFDDADIRTTIAQTRGTADEGAGIMFWSLNNSNCYLAGIDREGSFGVLRLLKGKPLSPVAWQKSDLVKKEDGQTNDLRVVTKGNSVTVYINGQQAATFQGFPPGGGGFVGLWGESGSKEPYRWEFSSFSVRKPH